MTRATCAAGIAVAGSLPVAARKVDNELAVTLRNKPPGSISGRRKELILDLLDRLLGHDAWTTGQLLSRCQTLSDEQLDREFDIGHQTVRATLVHIIRNTHIWSRLMAGRPVGEPPGRSIGELRATFNEAAAELAAVARSVAQRGAWNDSFLDVLDNPPLKKSFGGGIAHVITHSMHHRAQLLYMLRRLGLEQLPEGDVLSWEKQVTLVKGAEGVSQPT